MVRAKTSRRTWLNYLLAVLAIGAASGVRALFLGELGRGIPYLTYYPAVMISALYGSLPAGLLATGVSGWLTYYWVQQGSLSTVEWLAMGVFLTSCTMISAICEAMRRAQARAKQAQEQAEAANRAKSVFLASISHELRTPLNAILGFSSLMRNDPGTSPEQQQTLDIINRSGEHLLNLINDVLDMAKIEAGRTVIENTATDLGGILREINSLMGMRAEEKGLQLVLDQSSAFPRFVQVDAAKLRQVLINLVGNAVKYTEQGTVTLRLNARPTADPQNLRLIIEVEDTGIGIAPEDQNRIFQPFMQVSQQASQQGTGLGLAIARQYVELMGGRIEVASMPGQGSTFRVQIPASRVEESEVTATGIDQQRVVGLAPGQPEYRLLIVEDQLENWLLLRQLLENAGLPVRVAENGAAGVEMFQTWRPHFIWMDIRMQVMDGMEATRRIRALDGGGEVKIVALTASAFSEQRDEILSAGMDDFIHKPYRPDEIYACLERHLGLRFVYAEAPAAASDPEPHAAPAPEDLASLPAALRRELADTLISLDGPRIALLIRRIADHDPELAKTLEYYAGRLEYTAILRALQTGAACSIEATHG